MIEFVEATKRYPGVTALKDISFEIQEGTCHAVVGENGAGKSTLGKVLAGIESLDAGILRLDGSVKRFTAPLEAIEAGVGIVHQELAFCENLTVAENLCLGNLPSRASLVSRARMEEQAEAMLSAIDPDLPVQNRLGDLPIGRQQMVQIASSVSSGARVIIFDEPTSSLSHVESERLFERINWLKSEGVTCVYISHDMDEIFRICDAVTVLRDGQHVDTLPVGALDRDRLIGMMIGRSLEAYFPSHMEYEPGEELLRVENLSSPGKIRNISFSVRSGEIVGLAGLVGAGRTEAACAVFGLDAQSTGRVFVSGKETRIKSPAEAMGHGLGYLPEDRKRFGLVLSMRVQDNITLNTVDKIASLGWIRAREETTLAQTYMDRLAVRAPGLSTVTAGLSGGNQQKLVLARWLAANCRVLLVDEPTRGVDVGAKVEMHNLLDELAGQGSGIVLISSEMTEILNLSTRIIVFRNGEIAGELSNDEADQDGVMRLMTGS